MLLLFFTPCSSLPQPIGVVDSHSKLYVSFTCDVKKLLNEVRSKVRSLANEFLASSSTVLHDYAVSTLIAVMMPHSSIR